MAPIVLAPIAAEAVAVAAGTTATGLALWYHARSDAEKQAAVQQIQRGLGQLVEAETYNQALGKISIEVLKPTLQLFVALSHLKLLERPEPGVSNPSPAEVARVLAEIARSSGNGGTPPPRFDPPNKPGGFEPSKLIAATMTIVAIGLYKISNNSISLSNANPGPKLPEVPVKDLKKFNDLPQGPGCAAPAKEFPKLQLRRGLTYRPTDPDVAKVIRDFLDGKESNLRVSPSMPSQNQNVGKEAPTISASSSRNPSTEPVPVPPINSRSRRAEAEKIISLLRATSAGEGVRTKDDLARYLGYHPKTFSGILSGKLNVEDVQPLRSKLESALGKEAVERLELDVFSKQSAEVLKLSEQRRAVIARIKAHVINHPRPSGEPPPPVKTNEDIAKLLGLHVKTISAYIAGRDHFSEERLRTTRESLRSNVNGVDPEILEDLKVFQKPTFLSLRPPPQTLSPIRNRAIAERHEVVGQIGALIIQQSEDGRITARELSEIFSASGRTLSAVLRGSEDLSVDAIWQIERKLKIMFGEKEAAKIDLDCFKNPEAPLRPFVSIKRTEALHKLAEALLPEEALQPISKIRKPLAETMGILEQLLSKVVNGDLDLPQSQLEGVARRLESRVENIRELLLPLTKEGSERFRMPDPAPAIAVGESGWTVESNPMVVAEALRSIAKRVIRLKQGDFPSLENLEIYLGVSRLERFLDADRQLQPSTTARIIKRIKPDIPEIENLLLPIGRRFRPEIFEGSGREEAFVRLVDALVRYEVIPYASMDKIADGLGMTPSRLQKIIAEDESMLTARNVHNIVQRLGRRIPNIEQLLLPFGSRVSEDSWSNTPHGSHMLTLAKALLDAGLITHVSNKEMERALGISDSTIQHLTKGRSLGADRFVEVVKKLKPAVPNIEELLQPWHPRTDVKAVRTPKQFDFDKPEVRKPFDPEVERIIDKIIKQGYYDPD